MRMAMVGLGKMGANMARRLCRGGIEVVGYNRSPEIVQSLAKEEGLIPAASLAEVVGELSSPRVIWIMLPAGETTELAIRELFPMLVKGDIIVDGGNSNFHVSVRRGQLCDEAGIGFMDSGASGGVWGLANGYCLMVGGASEVVIGGGPARGGGAPAPGRGGARGGPGGAGHY